MNCPYQIIIDPENHLWDFTATEYLKWLKQNQITRYRWRWCTPHENKIVGIFDQKLEFTFKRESDAIHFALRWA